jgi:hypothetical protein
MCVTAASGGYLLFAQYWPFAILKPKNRKTDEAKHISPYVKNDMLITVNSIK